MALAGPAARTTRSRVCRSPRTTSAVESDMTTNLPQRRRRVVILGAAGRDFHDFNVVFRDDPAYEVVAFTATQIPDIGGRRYPSELAGALYPQGIPIVDESDLVDLVIRDEVDVAVFAYSDVSHV